MKKTILISLASLSLVAMSSCSIPESDKNLEVMILDSEFIKNTTIPMGDDGDPDYSADWSPTYYVEMDIAVKNLSQNDLEGIALKDLKLILPEGEEVALESELSVTKSHCLSFQKEEEVDTFDLSKDCTIILKLSSRNIENIFGLYDKVSSSFKLANDTFTTQVFSTGKTEVYDAF